jgi:hypothetical protein
VGKSENGLYTLPPNWLVNVLLWIGIVGSALRHTSHRSYGGSVSMAVGIYGQLFIIIIFLVKKKKKFNRRV